MNAAMPSGTNVTFAYDADGHRINQTIGAQATKYLWDTLSPYGDVIRETDGTGNQTAAYTLGGMELLSQTRAGATNFYLHDGQGSTRMLLNTSGNVTDSYVYDAFGNGQHTAGTTINSYQYTGQQFDSATGLYDLRARYYDPGSGRFGSIDPFRDNFYDPNQSNKYIYAQDNSTNGNDPSGLLFVEDVFQAMKSDLASVGLRKLQLGAFEGGIAGGLGYIAGCFMAANWAARSMYTKAHPVAMTQAEYARYIFENIISWTDVILNVVFGAAFSFAANSIGDNVANVTLSGMRNLGLLTGNYFMLAASAKLTTFMTVLALRIPLGFSIYGLDGVLSQLSNHVLETASPWLSDTGNFKIHFDSAAVTGAANVLSVATSFLPADSLFAAARIFIYAAANTLATKFSSSICDPYRHVCD